MSNLRNLKYLPQGLIAKTSKIQRPYSYKSTLTKEKLQILIDAGKIQVEMCKELGIARSTLAKYFREFGLKFPTRKQLNDPTIIIEREKLQKLIEQEKTLKEISTELNVPVGKVRYYLEKYNLANSNLEECAILRQYYSAKTPDEQANAVAEIDKILVRIAKEEYKFDRVTSFEDFLQDVRLCFYNLAEKKQRGRRKDLQANIFRVVKELTAAQQVKSEAKKLSFMPAEIAETDIATKYFEESDFLEYLIQNSGLVEREKYVVDGRLGANKTCTAIGKELNLAPKKIKSILEAAIEKFIKRRRYVLSEEFFQKRIETYKNILKDIDKNPSGNKFSARRNYVCYD